MTAPWPTRSERPPRTPGGRDPLDTWASITGRCLTVAAAITLLMVASNTDPPGNSAVTREPDTSSSQR